MVSPHSTWGPSAVSTHRLMWPVAVAGRPRPAQARRQLALLALEQGQRQQFEDAAHRRPVRGLRLEACVRDREQHVGAGAGVIEVSVRQHDLVDVGRA